MPPIKNTPIGITFPIQDGSVGYFEQSTDNLTAYRMNIINLLRTRQGERRMNPTFGSRLWTVIFDPNDSFVSKRIESIVKEDVMQWIPGVTVSSVQVQNMNNGQSTNLVDIYKLYIVVTFVINSINISDSVTLTLDMNKV